MKLNKVLPKQCPNCLASTNFKSYNDSFYCKCHFLRFYIEPRHKANNEFNIGIAYGHVKFYIYIGRYFGCNVHVYISNIKTDNLVHSDIMSYDQGCAYIRDCHNHANKYKRLLTLQ